MKTYAELLPLAKEHPETTDFTALRMGYTLSDQYNPYPFGEHDTSLGKLISENNLDGAIEVIGKMLERNYCDIQTHITATNIYKKLNIEAKANYHVLWVQGLVKSIIDSGDGRSEETACVVISTSEEYAVLNVMGLRPASQRLIRHDGHGFDLLTVVNPENQQHVNIYFNIDIPMRWLERHPRG